MSPTRGIPKKSGSNVVFVAWLIVGLLVAHLTRGACKLANPPSILGNLDLDRALIANGTAIAVFLLVAVVGWAVSRQGK